MDEIIKFIQKHPHTILYHEVSNGRLYIYTVFNELINIGPLKFENKENLYEVIITKVGYDECDYQAFTLDIIDLFKLLNDLVCSFDRGYFLDDEGDEDEF